MVVINMMGLKQNPRGRKEGTINIVCSGATCEDI
jgi:hypothetical protein